MDKILRIEPYLMLLAVFLGFVLNLIGNHFWIFIIYSIALAFYFCPAKIIQQKGAMPVTETLGNFTLFLSLIISFLSLQFNNPLGFTVVSLVVFFTNIFFKWYYFGKNEKLLFTHLFANILLVSAQLS
jgi:hypothetical protein